MSELCETLGCHRPRGHTDSGPKFWHRHIRWHDEPKVIEWRDGFVLDDRTDGERRRR
jgi:hypothetical protein